MTIFDDRDIRMVVYVGQDKQLYEKHVFPDGKIHIKLVRSYLPCEVGEGMISGWERDARGKKPDNDGNIVIRETTKAEWRIEVTCHSRGQFSYVPRKER